MGLYTVESPAWSIHKQEAISRPPIIDLKIAERARHTAEMTVKKYVGSSSQALTDALALAEYAQATSPSPREPRRFHQRIAAVCLAEKTAQTNALLPTIGFEAEEPDVPRSTWDSQNRSSNRAYALLHTALGLPINRLNEDNEYIADTDHYSRYIWEFSTRPAFSFHTLQLHVQSLFKSGLIPRHLLSQDPQDIKALLSNNLTSFHINLGLPNNLMRTGSVTEEVQVSFDYFARFLAIAHTSPQRLLARNSQLDIFRIKKGETTTKSSAQRLELIAGEYRTQRVYPSLEDAQILGASLFASLLNLPLGIHWERLIERFGPYIGSHPLFSEVDNTAFAEGLEKDPQLTTLVQRQLRQIVPEIKKTMGDIQEPEYTI